ncbi:MAG: helix-turn-helix transcriptional regulator [Parvularculaceae bacterium]
MMTPQSTLRTPQCINIGIYKIEFSRRFAAGDLGLSKREQELLVILVQGYTLKQIAHQLNVTPNTAATMKTRIYRKLGVKNLAGAATIASAFQAGAVVEKYPAVKNRQHAA